MQPQTAKSTYSLFLCLRVLVAELFWFPDKTFLFRCTNSRSTAGDTTPGPSTFRSLLAILCENLHIEMVSQISCDRAATNFLIESGTFSDDIRFFFLWGKLLELYEIDRQFHGRDGVNLWCFDIYRRIWPLIPYIRKPTTMHRMILESDNAWTLFITGPRVRDWGFRVPPDRGGDKEGWMHHVEFCAINGD